MSDSEIRSLFAQFARLNVGVIGDFAVDLYCTLQTRTGELSLETGRTVFWGSRPRTSLGGAGNVVQNLAALGIGNIRVFGCVGNDLFGREMQHLFQSLHVDTQQLRVLPAGWDTCVYSKPNLNGREHNRLDFGTTNRLADDEFPQLLTALEKALPDLDVLIINQQFSNPLLTTSRTERLNNLISRHKSVRFVADMRQTGQYIRNATLKANTAELAHFLNVPLPDDPDLTWCEQQGNRFRQTTQGPLLITRGPAGMLYLDEQGTQSVNGLPLTGELDTVGAGDTVVAVWAACAGAGSTPEQALELANLAAGVTVQKLAQTGTASLSEILNLHQTQSAYDQRPL